jgi:hypothetical protein
VSIARELARSRGEVPETGESLAGVIRGTNEPKRKSGAALIYLHRFNHLPRFARKHFLHLLVLLVLSAASGAGDTRAAVLESTRASRDAELQTDPASAFWRDAGRVYAERDLYGTPVPLYRTEIRSRWTRDNLYFLFLCPYEELYLKPAPDAVHETNHLWNWDVAEAFIGSDFENIQRYKEFEISPQGEWIDLDINLGKPLHEQAWIWNSGFQVVSRVDRDAKIWYGAMRIPFAALADTPVAPGSKFRINLFRSQGPPARQKQITWQSPMGQSFHVPERFGLLTLVTGDAQHNGPRVRDPFVKPRN